MLSLNNLGLLYYFRVRYTEAEPLYLEAINIFREGLGENHSHTQTVYRNYRGMLS
ncbi:MAG: tetratricopeptide repeat protein [Microcystis panniformis]|nr:tetratricopeptide repeat protein [Microcystis aeruginosa F13-15]